MACCTYTSCKANRTKKNGHSIGVSSGARKLLTGQSDQLKLLLRTVKTNKDELLTWDSLFLKTQLAWKLLFKLSCSIFLNNMSNQSRLNQIPLSDAVIVHSNVNKVNVDKKRFLSLTSLISYPDPNTVRTNLQHQIGQGRASS